VSDSIGLPGHRQIINRNIVFGLPMWSASNFKSALLILAAALAVAAAPGLPAPQSDADPSTEYMVKAAFIYNFALFVDWPAEAFAREDSAIVIGIVGTDPFGLILDRAVINKTAKGRPFVVQRHGVDPGLRGCHILFIGSSEMANFQKIKDIVKDLPILTIGEADTVSKSGGIINLVLENKRVGLEINVTAAKQAHLSISSKLLKLAKTVG
jgi:hypothetical protein